MSEEYAHILRNAIAEHNLITVKKLISEKKSNNTKSKS